MTAKLDKKRELRVRRYQLSPRIRLVVEQQPAALTAAVGFFVACGSRHEPARLNGITHLVEHLFFKGTTQHSAEEISALIEMYGGDLNAFTDREYTCFHAWVPTERTQSALNLISEMLFDSVMDEDDFDKEIEVVLQELRGYEDSPDDEFSDGILETPWGAHPLGRRIGGFSQRVKHITHKQMLAYIVDTFLASPLVIAVSSPLEADEVLAQVRIALKRAESFQWGKRLKARPLFGGHGRIAHRTTAVESRDMVRHQPRPVMSRPLFKRSRTRGFDSDQAQLAFIYPAVSIDHRDEIVWTAVATLLGSGSSSKLFREIREYRGLSYSVGAQLYGFTDSGLLVGYLATDRKQLIESTKVAGRVMREMSRGVTSADVDFVKSMMEGSILMSFEGVQNRMETIGRQELLMGRTVSLRETLKELDRVDQHSLSRVSRHLEQTPCFYALGPVSKRDLRSLKRAWESDE